MKQLNPNDVWCALVITLVGIFTFVHWGHEGVVASVAILSGWWIFTDAVKIWQWCSNGQEPKCFMSSAGSAQCPELSIYWYFGSALLQTIGVTMQLILGFTLCSGLILVGFYLGCSSVLHLKYYSSTTEDNALTMIPEIFMTLLIGGMVLTAPLDNPGYMGVGRFGALFLMELAAVTGAVIAYFELRALGVVAETEQDEKKVLWVPPNKEQDTARSSTAAV